MLWDLLLVPARVLHLGASVSLAGALVFHVAVGPLPLRRWLGPALGLTLLAAGLRLFLLAGAFTAADGLAPALAALPEVAAASRIGQALLLQAGLLVAAVALAWLPGWRLAPVAALLALAGQLAPLAASHAAAMQDVTLQAALAIHVLAGTVWLGGLLPLWQSLSTVGLEQRQYLLLRFSGLGLAMVSLLALTAVWQAIRMAGDVPGLLGTTHGQLMLAKSALFVAMLGLAASNRFIFLPRVATGIRPLRASILAEAALGIVVLALAGWLASTPPALHQPPVWPLPWRLAAWAWRPNASWAFGLAVCLPLSVLLTGRRRRVAICLAALSGAAFGAGGLQLAWAPATPTSFQTAPEGFTTDAILRGEVLLTARPALLPLLTVASSRITEGDLFWQAGLAAPELDSAQRWDVVQFLRASQAGVELREERIWSRPLPAPDLPLLCRQTGPVRLSDLRGKVLRLAIGFAPSVPDALTISLDPGAPTTSDCAATDGTARHAYALLSGMAAEPRLDGLWWLVDGSGWLRGSGFRTTPDILEEAARTIGAAPLAAGKPHH